MNNGMDTLLNLFFRGEPLEKIPGGVKLAEALMHSGRTVARDAREELGIPMPRAGPGSSQ